MPEQAPDGSIIITPKEFYDGVQSDIKDIKNAVSPLPQLRLEVEEHSRDIASLKKIAWVALGVAVGSGGADLLKYLG
jgi:hypothetical protein